MGGSEDRVYLSTILTVQGSPHKTLGWFLNRNFADQVGLAWNMQSDEKLRTYN